MDERGSNRERIAQLEEGLKAHGRLTFVLLVGFMLLVWTLIEKGVLKSAADLVRSDG